MPARSPSLEPGQAGVTKIKAKQEKTETEDAGVRPPLQSAALNPHPKSRKVRNPIPAGG